MLKSAFLDLRRSAICFRVVALCWDAAWKTNKSLSLIVPSCVSFVAPDYMYECVYLVAMETRVHVHQSSVGLAKFGSSLVKGLLHALNLLTQLRHGPTHAST